MEEISPAMTPTLSLDSNSTCENPGISNMEIAQLKIKNLTAHLFSSRASVLDDNSSCTSWEDEGYKSSVTEDSECASSSMLTSNDQIPQNNGHKCGEEEDDENLSVSDVELLPFDPISDVNLPIDLSLHNSKPIAVEIEGSSHGQIVAKVIALEERNIRRKLSDNSGDCPNAPLLKESVIALQLPGEKISRAKSVFELDCVPLWGSSAICGHRSEMEDFLTVVPHFTKIPIKMLIGDGMDIIPPTLTHLTSHFFGVYDGHGGSQVSNYCRDRIHSVLQKEIAHYEGNSSKDETKQSQWEKVFKNCFERVDDEVSGKRKNVEGIQIAKSDENTEGDNIFNAEPIAPVNVGSTAVVAVVCSSHVIVANCGDSRAVLSRGKEAIALSVDHKPNREDERARIEALGGKVFWWDGYRVSGHLAMSRSIGDGYHKPYTIAEPEVTFLPRAREDECLVLASDGLWDVMTNEEACEFARKRILLWHKKNDPLADDRGLGADPAAQAAAEYLSSLAIRKGSTDNVSVVVVDLKARKKGKNGKS